MSQRSSVPQVAQSVSQVLKRDSVEAPNPSNSPLNIQRRDRVVSFLELADNVARREMVKDVHELTEIEGCGAPDPRITNIVS